MSDLNAAALSLRSLLNCVLREYPERVAFNRSSVRIGLSPSGNGDDTPRVPFEHRSPTGHRLFGAPLHLVQGVDTLIEPQAAAELLLERLGGADGADDLRRRLRARNAFIARALAERSDDLSRLTDMRLSFGASEQGLLASHPIPRAQGARRIGGSGRDTLLAGICRALSAPLLRLPPDYMRHFLHTTLFVCVLRFVSTLLSERSDLSEAEFWRAARRVVDRYAERFTELAERLALFDVLGETCPRLCLNRVRLFTHGYSDDAERPVPDWAGEVRNPLRAFETAAAS